MTLLTWAALALGGIVGVLIDQPTVTGFTLQHTGTFNVTALGKSHVELPRTCGHARTITGEATWVAPGGRMPYWRGTIVSPTYKLARSGEHFPS